MGNSLKSTRDMDGECELPTQGEAGEEREQRAKEVLANGVYEAADAGSFDPWKIDEGEDLLHEKNEASALPLSRMNGDQHTAESNQEQPLEQTQEPEGYYDEYDNDSDILAAVESNTSLKQSRIGFLKNLQGPPLTFRLLFDSLKQKQVEEKVLTVDGDMLTQSVEKLKLCIEHHHSIPACIQTVTFDNSTLEDHKPLIDYYLREGDIVKVSFDRTGDLAEIMEIIDNMKATYIFLKSLERDLRKGTLKDSALQQISKKVCSQDVESLPEMYFSSTTDQAEVNRIFFVDCGGIRMCHKLHEELLKYPWSHLPLKLQALELAILRSFWNLTADFNVRMAVLHKSRALQNIIKSFLRLKVDENSRRIRPPFSMYREHSWKWNNSAINLPFKSMGALCK